VTWLTWRQFRWQAAVVLGSLVVLAIVLLVTGPHLVGVEDAFLKQCQAAKDCNSTPDPVNGLDRPLQIALGAIVLIVPALVGMFWGAPLVAREIETGTYRLGWTQSVTRARWVTIKLAVVGGATVALASALTLMGTWWYSPLERARQDQFQLAIFGLRGIAPIGYATFAFTLGVTLGVIVRRTLPAMASTLVAFVLTRLAVTYWVRPHLLPPVHTNVALTTDDFAVAISNSGPSILSQPPLMPNAWVYSGNVVDRAGRAPTTQWVDSACSQLAQLARRGTPGASMSGGAVSQVHKSSTVAGQYNTAFATCAQKVVTHFREALVYQPASRYWALQGLETMVFVALAALLAGAGVWWVRHRMT
jgi:hypothetical protein